MRKVSVYKCPVCGMRFKSLSGWGEHIERLHPDTIPDGYSVARYFYYVDTGKTHGSCVQCHKPTEWNEATGKYSRYCSDPNCKKKYCAEAKKRMVDKYGVPHLLNDPDQQRKMLASKSKPYKFRDGGSVLYLSSYEKDFLMTCEFVLGLKSKDIMGPSPHTYTYMYEGKQHFYIPDFYIPDLNLEIEIKDGGDNFSGARHIVEYDRFTEKVKDEVMIKNPKVNYFKVVNKEYQDFYRFLLECKLAIDDDMVKRVEMELLPATESAFINHKDEYFNIDKWQRKKGQNILYITGLSGSGKSTLGEELSKSHDAFYIELDRITREFGQDEKWNPNGYQKNVSQIFRKMYAETGCVYEKDDSYDTKRAKFNSAFNWLLDYCTKRPELLFIWEGIHISARIDHEYLKDKPMIIKGTSKHTSLKRMTIREANVYDEQQRAEMKAWYAQDEHNLDKLRKFMRTNAEKSPVLESSASSVIWDIFHADEVEEASVFEHVPQPATESALTSKERTDFGLPDIKKYPMPDAEHVMLAIKFFNYVNEDREKELADAINAKITEFGITDINIGENNRFGKYYKPAEDSVMTGWAPNVPYSGIVAKESAMPEFVYEPIKFNDRLWQSYQGKRYYPLYIGLMKNISPLGTVIRSFTKENWSHSFISFDPSMGECFTFGNKVIKKGIINARGFGAGIESFNPKANHFSYPPSTEYALHVMFFEESQIKAVKNTVDNIFAHREKYRYNVGGLINYIFNNPKTDPENLFCSQFVALVINSGKQGILDRDPSLYSPGSLADLRGTFYVCNGMIKNYDKLKAEIRTKEIFNDIIKTQNIEALEHSSLTYNADWEDSEDIELAGGYMVP